MCTFSMLFNALHFLWAVFLPVCFVSNCAHAGMAPPKMFYNISIGFNEAKTNCRIAQVLGILLLNSCDFFEQKNLPSVLFEEII